MAAKQSRQSPTGIKQTVYFAKALVAMLPCNVTQEVRFEAQVPQSGSKVFSML